MSGEYGNSRRGGRARQWRLGMMASTALTVGCLWGMALQAGETGAGAPAVAQAAQQANYTFSLPAQSLRAALVQYTAITGVDLVFDGAIADNVRSQPLAGTFTAEQALQRLLVGSGFGYRFTGPSTVILERRAAGDTGVNTLDPVTVEGRRAVETAFGPVPGYIARRTSSGTKTDTPLIETPQSVSVVTADQMRTTKPSSVSEALAYTPGVNVQSPAFSRMVDDFTVRGFNVANGNLGVLRDGMKYQSNVYDGGQEPYGLERIEVLKGAASVLYGQLNPGGAINYISKRPTIDPLHEVNLAYGSYERKEVSADLGGPITEDGVLSYRLTGLLRDGENWVDHVPDDKRYIAPAFTWKPSAATSLTLLGSYQEIRTRFAAPMAYEDLRSGRIPRDRFTGEPDFDRYNSNIYTAGYLFEHAFDENVKVRSNLRYFRADVKWDYLTALALDAGGNLTRGVSVRDEKSTGFTTDNSIEAKFATGAAAHTVLAGVDFYRRTYNSHRFVGTAPPLNVDNPDYGGNPVVNRTSDRGSEQIGRQVGLYIQDQVKIHDKLVLLFGGRYDWSDTETESYRTGELTRQKDDAFTGRAGIVYLFDNGLAPFASISQSFSPTLGTDREGNPFKPTEGLQYEAGLRYQPPGTDVLLTGAVFQIEQKNVQTPDPLDSNFAVQTGKVRSRGVELEARAKFGSLSLIAGYAYTDAKVTKSNIAAEVGEQLILVPKHTVSLWADYELDQVGLKGLKIGAGVRHSTAENLPGYPRNVPGRTLVDALVSYDFGGIDPRLEGASLAVNASNLFNEKYMTCSGSTGCRYGAPRTILATLSYRW